MLLMSGWIAAIPRAYDLRIKKIEKEFKRQVERC